MMAKSLNAVSVERPGDKIFKGSGKIYQKPLEGTYIYGKDTLFESEIQPHSLITIPGKCNAFVSRIISDTCLEIKEPLECAEDLLTNDSNYTVTPHINQKEMFAKVFSRLKEGGSIGLFPEGGSHDRAEFLPLKAGVTIMALGSMASSPELDVKIIPVGFHYFHRSRFRSRAVLEFGQSISISSGIFFSSLITLFYNRAG